MNWYRWKYKKVKIYHLHFNTAESSEEVPLTLKQTDFATNNGYDTAVDEVEKHLLNVLSHSRKTKAENQTKRNVSLIDSSTSIPAAYPMTNLHDINAMSVASIYDREDDEVMDADKWVKWIFFIK